MSCQDGDSVEQIVTSDPQLSQGYRETTATSTEKISVVNNHARNGVKKDCDSLSTPGSTLDWL